MSEIITVEHEIIVLMPPESANDVFVALFNWTLFTSFSSPNIELPYIRKQII